MEKEISIIRSTFIDLECDLINEMCNLLSEYVQKYVEDTLFIYDDTRIEDEFGVLVKPLRLIVRDNVLLLVCRRNKKFVNLKVQTLSISSIKELAVIIENNEIHDINILK